MPTAAQSVICIPSCTGSDRYCSIERGTRQRQHIAALEFMQENPPFEFYLSQLPSADNIVDSTADNSTDAGLTSQNTGAGLVPQNTPVRRSKRQTIIIIDIFSLQLEILK